MWLEKSLYLIEDNTKWLKKKKKKKNGAVSQEIGSKNFQFLLS